MNDYLEVLQSIALTLLVTELYFQRKRVLRLEAVAAATVLKYKVDDERSQR